MNHKEEVKMDEMKLKLSTKFMRGIVSKLISKIIYKNFGYKVNIQLNELDVSVIDGETKMYANVEIKMDSSEFTKLIKQLNSD